MTNTSYMANKVHKDNVDKPQNSSYTSEYLHCWYTNADTLTNKIQELKARLAAAENKPDLLIINEVKPKNNR